MGKSVKASRPAKDVKALSEAVAALEQLVAEQGAVLKTALTKHGVPRAETARAVEKLTAIGLEVVGRFIRVPVAKQLATQLATAGSIPLRSIGGNPPAAQHRAKDAPRGSPAGHCTANARAIARAHRAVGGAPAAARRAVSLALRGKTREPMGRDTRDDTAHAHDRVPTGARARS